MKDIPSDERLQAITRRERIPLALRPWLLTGERSTLHLIERTDLTGDERRQVVYTTLDAWYAAHGPDPRCLERGRMMASKDGAKIYQACAEYRRRAAAHGIHVPQHKELIREITKKEPRAYGAGSLPVARYAVEGECGSVGSEEAVPHPPLRSLAEVAVDSVLTAAIDVWAQHHAHDVPLNTLVPDADVDRRLSVDIVLLDAGVPVGAIEVGRGALKGRSGYRRRRRLKRSLLRRAGIPCFECDLPEGPRVIAELRRCAEWVVDALGTGVVPTDEKVRTRLFQAGAESVALYSLDEVRPVVAAWQAELGDVPLTFHRYMERVGLLTDDGDPRAFHMPAQTTLARHLARAQTTLAELAGGPARRGQPAHRHAGRKEKQPYEELRARVRAQGYTSAQDYMVRRERSFPTEPQKLYRRQFAADGWPGYLGTGASNRELRGLIVSSTAASIASIDWYRWNELLDDLTPDAKRAPRRGQANPVAYYLPERLVAHLLSKGAVDKRIAGGLLKRLQGKARSFREPT